MSSYQKNSTDITLDIASISRYHHITNAQFEELFAASILMQWNDIAKKYSLQNSLPILDQLQWKWHLQSPQDIYHLIAGKMAKLFKLTIVMLSSEGNKIFIDNPVVMPLDAQYGGGALYKYEFPGRISKVGVEKIFF